MIFRTAIKFKFFEIAIEYLFSGILNIKNHKVKNRFLINQLYSGMLLSEIRCEELIFLKCVIHEHRKHSGVPDTYMISFSYQSSSEPVSGGNPLSLGINKEEIWWQFIE
jgi:hypothetical protein